MADLDESFSKLLGRQPTDAERQQLYRVRDALHLESNDALWLVLMALQFYQGQYEAFPARIEMSAGTVLANLKETADATMKASAEVAKAALAKAIAATAEKVASNTSKKQKWRWACACIALTAACFGGFSWFIHQQAHEDGFNSGYGVGYSQAHDEKAAAAWSNTPEGKLAYRFAQTGELAKVARCQGQGWTVTNSVCYPQTASNGKVYGWRMP